MLTALADSVQEHLKKSHRLTSKVEGVAQNGWLLADYGDFVIHLFSPEQRDFYRLEELWSEGRIVLKMQ
jgi:ribosome-associated protein